MPKPTSMLQRWKLYCDATANRERPWLLPLLPVLAHAERYLASADGRLPGAGWSEVRGLRAPRRAYGVIRLREPTKHPHKFSGIFLHCYPQSSRRARPRAWTTTRSCSSRWSSVRSRIVVPLDLAIREYRHRAARWMRLRRGCVGELWRCSQRFYSLG